MPKMMAQYPTIGVHYFGAILLWSYTAYTLRFGILGRYVGPFERPGTSIGKLSGWVTLSFNPGQVMRR